MKDVQVMQKNCSQKLNYSSQLEKLADATYNVIETQNSNTVDHFIYSFPILILSTTKKETLFGQLLAER